MSGNVLPAVEDVTFDDTNWVTVLIGDARGKDVLLWSAILSTGQCPSI